MDTAVATGAYDDDGLLVARETEKQTLLRFVACLPNEIPRSLALSPIDPRARAKIAGIENEVYQVI